MHKIGDDTNTADVNGEWTEGGAGGTPPATILKAAWLNATQREFLNLLALFGITPNVSDDAQLREIMRRLKSAAGFAPRPTSTPSMAIVVGAGTLFTYQLVEQADQTTGTITAPSANPRIDRVVINKTTGAVSVITGTEAASPAAPAIPTGRLPIARVALAVGQTSILVANITDERGIGPISIPAPSANYTNGVAHYISDYGSDNSPLDLDANLSYDANWNSIGPTGSAGRPQHLIWPALDQLPDSATAVVLRFVATCSGSPTGVTGTAQQKIRGRKYNMNVAHAGQECVGFTAAFTSGNSGNWEQTSNVIIPLNLRRFELYYAQRGSVAGLNFGVNMYLVGWLDSLA